MNEYIAITMTKETEREEIKEETHELEDEEKDELEDEDDEEAWNEITSFGLKCHRQIGIITKGMTWCLQPLTPERELTQLLLNLKDEWIQTTGANPLLNH